jgi:hypothetical protein
MIRASLICLISFITITSTAQQTAFENAVNNLFFNVDIKKASDRIITAFLSTKALHCNDTVTRQFGIDVHMRLHTDSEAWTDRYIFIFTESPLKGLKIDSGYILVSIDETDSIRKLHGINWVVQFTSKKDGQAFFKEIKKIFAPVSTKQKLEHDKLLSESAQYSTRNTIARGIRDVAFTLSKSAKTKKYELRLYLMNEFIFR